MGQLGDVLELFYGFAEPFRSVRATIRQWRDIDISESASRHGQDVWGRKKARSEFGSATTQRTTESSLCVWMRKPSNVRIEERLGPGVDLSQEPSLIVINGEHWAKRDAEGHIELGKGGTAAPGYTEAERHFEPTLIRRIFQGLVLDARGQVRAAQRDCIRLRAIPRPGGGLWPHWLPWGADEYELHADRERGVLLALIGLYKGTIFSAYEVLEVYFDEDLPDELFTCAPQVGEQIRTPVPVVEPLSLAAAIKRMSFTVLVPSRMLDPDHVQLEVMYHPPRPASPREHLALLYRGGPWQFLSINESATDDPRLEEYEWEHLCHGGQDLRISDPGAGLGNRVVAMVSHGTHVTVWSDLERDQLIDLAASLMPATEKNKGKNKGDIVR